MRKSDLEMGRLEMGQVFAPKSLRSVAAFDLIDEKFEVGSGKKVSAVASLIAVASFSGSAEAQQSNLPPVTVDAPVERPRPAASKPSPEQIRAQTGGQGVQVAVDAVGSLMDQAVDVAAVGGRVVLFGMNERARPAVHQYTITRRELTILSTFVGIHTFPKAVRMLERGVIKPSVLLSPVMPLSEAPKAFDLLRRGEAIKIMLKP